jgi:hypothetical protein
MFIRVLQNDPNWHTLDRLPVPYAIDRKKLATMGGRGPPRSPPGGPACSNHVALDLTVPQMSQDL